jgi:importin-5
MKIFSNEHIGESWRQLSLEVLITLSETAQAMVRKVGAKYIGELVQIKKV